MGIGRLFVLALNRQQLDQAARTLYGESMEPERYFKRFFDIETKLPKPHTEALIKSVLRDLQADQEPTNVQTLETFLARSPYSIRQIKRTLLQYAMVSFSMQTFQRDGWWWIPAVAVLLHLAVERPLWDFTAQRASDADLIDAFFSLDWTTSLRETDSGRLVEATVIATSSSLTRSEEVAGRPPDELLERYQGRDSEHSRELLAMAAQMGQDMRPLGSSFKSVVERIEAFDTSGLRFAISQ